MMHDAVRKFGNCNRCRISQADREFASQERRQIARSRIINDDDNNSYLMGFDLLLVLETPLFLHPPGSQAALGCKQYN